MDSALYREFFEMENDHWWFRARRDIIRSLIQKYCFPLPSPTKKILDIGCGTGLGLKMLNEFSSQVDGCDMSPDALAFAARNGASHRLLQVAFPDEWKKIDSTYDLTLMLDVLEHIEDDREALLRIHDLLNERGKVVITIPTHPSFWSTYDEHCHHKRRYTKKSFLALVEATPFRIRFVSYYNFFLFLPIVIFRGIKSALKRDIDYPSDIFLLPKPINAVFYWIFSLEKVLLPFNILPTGLSFIAVLEKRD